MSSWEIEIKMVDVVAQAQFEQFCKMRLAGMNDEVYRSYDLLTRERAGTSIRLYAIAAGQYVPHGQAEQVLRDIQSRWLSWGYTKTLGDVETMLHEFWVWKRIKYNNKRGWPLRHPEDSVRLYQEHVEAEQRKES